VGNYYISSFYNTRRQESFMTSYVGEGAGEIFGNVAAMVFVFDTNNQNSTVEKQLDYFEQCTGALQRHSPEAKLFILLHKSDLFASPSHAACRELESKLKRMALPTLAICHYTSIWDESIYRAWSSILISLLPSIASITAELARFTERCKLQEAILFERQTYLVLAHAGKRHPDARRFEKISNILKQVRMTTKKFEATPVSFSFILGDDELVGLILEQVNDDALLLIVDHNANDERLEALSLQIINSFKPILSALLAASVNGDGVDVDPHLLS